MFIVTVNCVTVNSLFRLQFLLTNDGAVAEEQLMKLWSEGSKKAAKGGNKTAQNCCYSCTFFSAKRYCNRRHEQGNTRRHCPQPSCKMNRHSWKIVWTFHKFYLIVQTRRWHFQIKAQRVWLREDGVVTIIMFRTFSCPVLSNNATFQILIVTGIWIPSMYLSTYNVN